jgi:SAM-dependent methyltransferase
MNYDSIRDRVQRYYDEKVKTHGPTARGVDWNSAESQQVRFEQLLKLVEARSQFAINDFGCGYGALAGYLEQACEPFVYCGFDISNEMIARARELHGGTNFSFVTRQSELPETDYTVASGIFNVKLETPAPLWEEYILDTIRTIDALSRKGFAFNVLTKYSDAEFMRPDLYYADPLFLLTTARLNFHGRWPCCMTIRCTSSRSWCERIAEQHRCRN